MELSFAFMIAGIIIMTGFFGIFFFDKTRIPDVLLLLGVGVLIGPVFGFIDPGNLSNFAEYFGSLALIIILFDGGMDMDLDRLISEFGAASLLVVVSFVLTSAGIASYLYFAQGWDLMLSLLLGTTLGNTSAPVIIPIINRMEIKGEIKTLISVESALSDVLAVVVTLTLVDVVTRGSTGISTPFRAIASSFSTAAIGGGLAGFVWLKVLNYVKDRRYSYMFTLAAVLVVFGAVSFMGGSGPMAVLIFGIVLGNGHSFANFLNISNDSLIESTIKFFHGEMTFFIRTFFFVYIGMIITFRKLDLDFSLLCGAILLVIIVTRFISVSFTSHLFKEKKPDRLIMMSMLPRGLTSAVLAIVPTSMNILGSGDFVDITFAVIIMTNLIMTIGVYFVERGMKKSEQQSLFPG